MRKKQGEERAQVDHFTELQFIKDNARSCFDWAQHERHMFDDFLPSSLRPERVEG